MSLLDETLSSIGPQDAAARAAAHARLEALAMPYWALGRLMDLAEDLAGMTGSTNPPVERKSMVVMAGDHGVVADGVSAYPQEVTVQMVANIATGGASINALARQVGATVTVVDVGVAGDLSALGGAVLSRRVAPGTASIARGPAMSRGQAVRALEAGIEVAQRLGPTTDVFGTGEMGIGNTTPSSAIVAAVSGAAPAEVTGRGTGLDDKQLQYKARVVERCLQVNGFTPGVAGTGADDGVDLLAKLGGFEIGGIAGLMLGAAALRRPVVIDGFISTAGALVAQMVCPASTGYMIAAHRSVEQGHHVALETLGKKPLLDMDLRLGEGTGAALAMNLVDAAKRVLTEVATFDEAAVSQRDR
ncbi:MAG: nicotinate-nucleotide--dimethylbenzimidazole phosphoribosyltransferase [Actinobacteria bacterium]|jgi:nicotinate-nucleotide--dimethylbenzimidazole phosphoribosyltransferase|nr:nicotinate-nucleotide--dimethylbenzimidazole phosphoribosyltransferase [Actinomycetota bacterium]